MDIKKIVMDIRTSKIQGSKTIAQAAINSLVAVADKTKTDKAGFVDALTKAKNIFLTVSSKDPYIINSLNFIMNGLEKQEDVQKAFNSRVNHIKTHISKANEKIAMIGSRKILNRSNVFIHGYSPEIIEILRHAKNNGKKFVVYNTETRPGLEGRTTAREAARLGIPVVHFVDSSARLAIKNADIILIGADAISKNGKIISRIGSELFAEIAKKYDVPVYICTDSLKFDKNNVFDYDQNMQDSKGVWAAAPEGVIINTNSYENIHPNLITGVISEIGIYKPHIFIEQLKHVYPHMH